MRTFYFVLITLMFVVFNVNLYGQDNTPIIKDAPTVYLKCWQCDLTRLKREINYVNYANQRQDADVLVIVTSQSTGTGTKNLIYFEGQHQFTGIADTSEVDVPDTETESVSDDKLISNIKQGLLRYIIRTPLISKINYDVAINNTKKEEIILDPWDSWVFSLSMRGGFSGESSYNRKSLNGSFRAGRVTKVDKWRFYASTNISERNYYFYDSNDVKIDTLTITSERKSSYMSGSYIRALTDHWSTGVFANGSNNTYSNYDLSVGMKLGVEYNFFNFDESDRKSIVLSYRIGPVYNDYVDTTIYNKLNELLFSQNISLDVYYKQKWGNVNFGAGFFSYLNDIRINSLSFNTNVSWNIFRGFTLDLGGYLSFINDQINLSKEDAGVIGTVLGDRLLATNYNAYTYVGIRYTFGSKFANAVNPRFNSGGGVTYYYF